MIKCVSVVSLALAALCGPGCAKDRNLDDYRRQQVEEEIAEMNSVRGEYRGMYAAGSRDDLGSAPDGAVAGDAAIGGLSVRIQPDRQSVAGGAGSSGGDLAQKAVLKITVTLLGATTKTLTFSGGSYDRSSRSFQANASIADRGTAQISGTFDGDRLVGTLEVAGYPDRGGSFALVRGAPAPALAGIRTRASAEEQFLFNSFGGIGYFRKGPPAWVNLVVLRQASVAEQDFMDVIAPYRRVDVSLFFNSPVMGADGKPTGEYRQSGGIFNGVVWDVRARTLTGTFSAPAAQGLPPTLLKLQCQETGDSRRLSETGWQCVEYSLANTMGEVFTATFRPGAQPPAALD